LRNRAIEKNFLVQMFCRLGGTRVQGSIIQKFNGPTVQSLKGLKGSYPLLNGLNYVRQTIVVHLMLKERSKKVAESHFEIRFS
jgi:hypothetical protein